MKRHGFPFIAACASLLLAGCHWTQAQRDQFKQACRHLELPNVSMTITFHGFTPREFDQFQMEFVRAGEDFLPSLSNMRKSCSLFYNNYSNHLLTCGIQLWGRFTPADSLRFTAPDQQVFAISGLKGIMEPQFTMLSEGYGCDVGAERVEGGRRDSDGELYFYKSGYPSSKEIFESLYNIDDADERLLRDVDLRIDVAEAFMDDNITDYRYHVALHIGDTLNLLRKRYLSGGDDFPDAESQVIVAMREQRWQTYDEMESAIRAAFHILKERQALFRQKVKQDILERQ
ncbi:MAG: hypothetical protein LBF93_02540 [Zoogloeaceae bacterium]|jgi:hypothetical protein|nr:hypothetical protein [Zoogloeaceae bacterium]